MATTTTAWLSRTTSGREGSEADRFDHARYRVACPVVAAVRVDVARDRHRGVSERVGQLADVCAAVQPRGGRAVSQRVDSYAGDPGFARGDFSPRGTIASPHRRPVPGQCSATWSPRTPPPPTGKVSPGPGLMGKYLG